MRCLSPSLYCVEDVCNVYVLRRGEQAILIDSGTGLAVEILDQLGIKQVEWVLHTHFHRDQCAGTPLLACKGARVAVPQAELGYFAGADDFWRRRAIFDNYDTYNDFFASTRNIAVDRVLTDYETFTWRDVELQILPAPGHTKGSIALCGEIDGRRVAFTGDAIHHSARPWTLFDLEWEYNKQTGLSALSLTLQTLAGLRLDLLLPSHGAPVTQPAAACETLSRKLSAYFQWLCLYNDPSSVGYSLLPWDTRLEPLTPHLWANTTSLANSYALVADDGAALFLDYGFPSYSHFSGNFRFAEHSLDELRRVAGLARVDAVMPSHYHDDHVCGLHYLHERYGAELWVFENQADILAHPEAYKIPCLWAKPMDAARVVAEGETFAWRGTAFTATRLPGHTAYHCGLFFVLDGRRIAHVGDTIARGITGPRFGGPIFQNRFTPGDFVESVAKIRDFEPEFILTGHFGALRIEPAFLDEAMARARSLKDILWGLIAVPEEAGFAFDPNWATLYPYQATARPGTATAISVCIVNHLRTTATAHVMLRLPEGWTGKAVENDVAIDRGVEAVLRFDVTPPDTAAAGERYMLAADVTLGERRFGPVAEGIIRIV